MGCFKQTHVGQIFLTVSVSVHATDSIYVYGDKSVPKHMMIACHLQVSAALQMWT